jgi:hypothetical protein
MSSCFDAPSFASATRYSRARIKNSGSSREIVLATLTIIIQIAERLGVSTADLPRDVMKRR